MEREETQRSDFALSSLHFPLFVVVVLARSIYFSQTYVAGIQSVNIERWTDFFIPLLTIFVHLVLLKWLPLGFYRILALFDFLIEVGIATYHDYFIENIDIHTILGAAPEGLQAASFALALIPRSFLLIGTVLLAVQIFTAREAKRILPVKLLWGLACVVLPLFGFAIYKIPLKEARLVTNYTMNIKAHGYYTAMLSDLLGTGAVPKQAELMQDLRELQRKNPRHTPDIHWLNRQPYEDLLVIQVESLDFQLLGYKHNGKAVTPFLSELPAKSILMKLYAFHLGVSGSSGADFQFLTGTLPLTTYPTFKLLSIDYGNSLPTIFSSRGVRSFAYHGNTASMWGRGRAYKKMGFTKFYDPADFSKPDTSWGLSDRLFFKEARQVISTNDSSPDFHLLISLSSHGPYNFVIHNAFQGNDLASRYFNSMNYVDGVLAEFFQRLRGNYLVILYGDHAANIKSAAYRSREGGKEFVPGMIFLLQDGYIRKPDSISGQNLLTGVLDIRSLHEFAREHFPFVQQ